MPDKPTPITFVQPCPPHQWGHAPTVGYFTCFKCDARVDHSDPQYAGLMAEREAGLHQLTPDKPTDEMIERARNLITERLLNHSDPGVQAITALFGVPNDTVMRVARALAEKEVPNG
ncbi:MAG: hypothetical protein V4696_03520 [Pseudomonadota bacterium]